MKIIFVQAPFGMSWMPSLGVGYLRGALEEKGHNTSYLDLSAVLYKEAALHGLDTLSVMPIYPKKVVGDFISFWSKYISEMKPDIVGFSVMKESYAYSIMLAREVRKCGAKIVFGGPLLSSPTILRSMIKTPYVDYLVPGEGENAVAELVRNLNKQDKIVTAKQVDLNRLPVPLFNKSNRLIGGPYSMLPAAISRGCIYKCTFCGYRLVHGHYKQRKIRLVVDDMEHGMRNCGIDTFWFCDNLMNGRKNNLQELSDEIMDRKLKFYWGGYIVPDRVFGRREFGKMYMGGCRFLRIGAESGSQIVLNHMRKGSRIENFEKTLYNAYHEDLHIRLSLMVGYPVEDNFQYKKTFDFLLCNSPFFNSAKVFEYGYEKERLEPDSILHLLNDLPFSVKYRRRKVLLLFTNVVAYGVAADLLLTDPNYRTHKNPKGFRQMFKRPLVVEDVYYTDTANHSVKIHKSVRFNMPDRAAFKDGSVLLRPLPPCVRPGGSCEDCKELVRIDGEIKACGLYLDRDFKALPEISACKSCPKLAKCYPCYYAPEAAFVTL